MTELLTFSLSSNTSTRHAAPLSSEPADLFFRLLILGSPPEARLEDVVEDDDGASSGFRNRCKLQILGN